MERFYYLTKKLAITGKLCRRKIMTGLMFIVLFMISQSAMALTQHWTGSVNTDATNPLNWDSLAPLLGNVLYVDSAYKFTNNPVFGGTGDISLGNFQLQRTSSILINRTNPTDLVINTTETPDLFGTINITSGILRIRRCEIELKTSIVNVSGNGTLECIKYLFFGGSGTPSVSGYLNISGNGVVRKTNQQATGTPGRFTADTANGGVITITENGRLEYVGGNWDVSALIARGAIKSSPDRDIVVKYDAGLNTTTIYSRDKLAFIFEPSNNLNLTNSLAGPVLRLVHNDGLASMNTLNWKYSTTSGSGYINFSPAQTGDTIAPIFNNSGTFYLICVGNNGTADVNSNEIQVIVSSNKVSVAPEEKQKLKTGQQGFPLTVTETEASTSRQWLYTATSGSGYTPFATAITGTECIPVFPGPGTYYVICQSTINAGLHNTKEVEFEILDGTPSFDMKWNGLISSDASDNRNWTPHAYIEQNNLIIEPGYTNAPVLSKTGNDTITGLDIQAGTSFTLNKPEGSVLRRGSDIYLNGELIINSGTFSLQRLRLESTTGILTMNGGTLINTTDFIAGGNNSVNGGTINIGGKAILDAGAQIWRFATDSTRSIITISDSAKIIVHANNWVPTPINAINTRQIRATAGDKLWTLYDDIDSLTYFYARDSFDLEITPFASIKNQAINSEGETISTVNVTGVTAYEWKYSATPFEGYQAFNPALTAATCKPLFTEPGRYFVVCEGTTAGGKVISNHSRINAISISIEPLDTQFIAPVTDGTQLTVNELPIASAGKEWKYTLTSGSGYESFPGGAITSNNYTPLSATAGTFYVVCISTYGETEIISNEVAINVVEVTLSPSAKQTIEENADGTAITVSENFISTSHEWKFATTSGGVLSSFTPAQTGTTYTPNFANEGSYFVVCESTYPGDAVITSGEVEIEVSPAIGIQDNFANGLNLYPNPSNGTFYIKINEIGQSIITISDIQGRIIVSEIYNNSDIQTITINEKGVYIVKINTESGVKISKIVIN